MKKFINLCLLAVVTSFGLFSSQTALASGFYYNNGGYPSDYCRSHDCYYQQSPNKEYDRGFAHGYEVGHRDGYDKGVYSGYYNEEIRRDYGSSAYSCSSYEARHDYSRCPYYTKYSYHNSAYYYTKYKTCRSPYDYYYDYRTHKYQSCSY